LTFDATISVDDYICGQTRAEGAQFSQQFFRN
jgi:hypothetical protein